MKQTTKTIWDEAIEDYKDYGFNIDMPDEFLLELYFKDNLIGTFYRDKISPNILIHSCKNYLKSIMTGNLKEFNDGG